MTRLAVVVLLATGAAACYESEVALDPVPLVAVDPALLGTWRCLPLDGEDDELAATLTITRSARDKIYDATWLEPGDTPDRYEAFASTVGGETLFNIRELKAGVADAKWVFGRVTLLKPNVLHVQIADDKALSGTEKTRPALRSALERLGESPALFTGGCVCARAKPAP